MLACARSSPLDRARAAAAQAGDSVIDPDDVLNKKIAVWRFDALGIDPEIVAAPRDAVPHGARPARSSQPLPTRRDIERVDHRAPSRTAPARRSAWRRSASGSASTSSSPARSARSATTTSSTSRSSTSRRGKSQKIQSDPLRGSPDELIEGVRVAAYRCSRRDQLHGAVQIQTDLVGAEVALDGKRRSARRRCRTRA